MINDINRNTINKTVDIFEWTFKKSKTIISKWKNGSFKQIKTINDSKNKR